MPKSRRGSWSLRLAWARSSTWILFSRSSIGNMPVQHRHVIWAPRARHDLADIWRYYSRVATVEVADRLLHEIDVAGRHLSENALRWRARDELAPGLRSVLVHPYVIFYRIKNGI